MHNQRNIITKAFSLDVFKKLNKLWNLEDVWHQSSLFYESNYINCYKFDFEMFQRIVKKEILKRKM